MLYMKFTAPYIFLPLDLDLVILSQECVTTTTIDVSYDISIASEPILNDISKSKQRPGKDNQHYCRKQDPTSFAYNHHK